MIAAAVLGFALGFTLALAAGCARLIWRRRR